MLASLCRLVVNKAKTDEEFENLAARFENLDVTQAQLASEINEGYAFSTQHQGRRKQENFLAAGYVGLDFDRADKASVEAVRADPIIKNYYGIFYRTASSTPQAPRFRIVFQLEYPIYDAGYYRRVVSAFIWKFGANVDKSCKDPCRLFYGSKGSNPIFTDKILPMSVVADVVKAYELHLEQERRLKEAAERERRKAVAPAGGDSEKGKKTFIAKVLETQCNRIRAAQDGSRHETLRDAATVMGGYLQGEPMATDEYDIKQALREAYSSLGLANRGDMEDAIEWGLEHGRGRPLYVEPLPAGPNIDFTQFNRATPQQTPVEKTPPTEPKESPKEEKPKRLWHVDELGEFPKPEWLVQDELQRNSMAFLIGESGSGKSFIAVHYSLQVAQTETVIYIAAEGASGYSMRIGAWRSYYQVAECHMYLWPSPLALVDPISRAEFLKEIAPLNPSLIVIDTLARSAVGLDENSAKDMGLLIAACDEIKQATKACVLVVHHTGKNGASERGSSALRGAADTMLKVVEDAELRKIVFDKQKDAAEKEPRYIKLLPVADSLVVVDADKNEAISSGKVKGKVKEVLEAMAGEIFLDTGATWKRLIEVLNWDSSAGRKAEMFKILNHLKKSNYIRQADKGEPYYITAAGLDLVREQPL